MFKSRHKVGTYYVPYGEISNTYYDAMLKITEILSIPESKIVRVSDVSENRKVRYKLLIQNSAKLAFLLYMIKPYLVIKRKQADIVLSYIDNVEGQQGAKLTKNEIAYRETIYGLLADLNRKGREPS